MTKTLTYSGLVIGSLLVILGFLTAKTYSQLAVAVVLYPALIFSAFMIFPRNGQKKSPKIATHEQPKLNPIRVENSKPKTEPIYVADFDKRAFIKLIGATGISFFLFSMFGRGIENLVFGRNGQYGINPTGNSNPFGQANNSPTDGYKISEIDENPVSYYGFTNQDGAWLIMQEGADGSSFRYAKGNSNFPDNWANRENLRYDYFYNLF